MKVPVIPAVRLTVVLVCSHIVDLRRPVDHAVGQIGTELTCALRLLPRLQMINLDTKLWLASMSHSGAPRKFQLPS